MEKLITQVLQGKRLSIENDCMLAVICSFGHKSHKAFIKATNQLYDIIEKEMILDEINYDKIDIKIEAREIINAYIKRAA